jgi:hypothetical protein
MKRFLTAAKVLMLALVVAFLAAPIRADQITIDESQMIWPQPMNFVSGFLFMCEGAAGNFLTGPCEGGLPSDIIIFNNEKHQVVFLSNASEGDDEPADVPFDQHLGTVINPRFVAEPAPVDGLSTLIWAPGPSGPGYYGTGNSWVIISDAPETPENVPEPSSALLLLSVLVLVGMAACRFRTSQV